MPTRCRDLLAAALALTACSSPPEPPPPDAEPSADPVAAPSADPIAPPPGSSEPPLDPLPAAPRSPRCPPEMVRVAGRFCVDRYEAILLDALTGAALSPYYPPSRRQADSIEKLWQRMRFQVGDPDAQRLDLPVLPAWQRARDFEPRAVPRKGVVPQGYTSGAQAALACRNAGKRLCTLEEWRTACRGERGDPFPYGSTYDPGRCNVFRESHPALVLHNDMSTGHSDPRLNLVKAKGAPLLRRTGETAACASAWDGDAVADMVGNVDEWIDDPEGTFAGGFYARATRDGCMATVSSHAFDYFDYSTGVRCCADPP